MRYFDHLGEFNPYDYPIDKLGSRNYDYTTSTSGSRFIELPAQELRSQPDDFAMQVARAMVAGSVIYISSLNTLQAVDMDGYTVAGEWLQRYGVPGTGISAQQYRDWLQTLPNRNADADL